MNPPVALTIAGSDSSGGAGLQADLKAFAASRVYGLTVATAVVAERPGAVLSIHPVTADCLQDQISAVLPHYPVAAIKTGLLPTAELIDVVRRALHFSNAQLVIDPVAIASTGTALAQADAATALRLLIQERATLVTPNRAEAEHFLEEPIAPGQVRDAAAELARMFGCAILLKGGHFDGPESIDWLADGDCLLDFRAPRLIGIDVHGTGCTYSAAITARLALGMPLAEAIRSARAYLQAVLEDHWEWTVPGGSRIKALANAPEP